MTTPRPVVFLYAGLTEAVEFLVHHRRWIDRKRGVPAEYDDIVNEVHIDIDSAFERVDRNEAFLADAAYARRCLEALRAAVHDRARRATLLAAMNAFWIAARAFYERVLRERPLGNPFVDADYEDEHPRTLAEVQRALADE